MKKRRFVIVGSGWRSLFYVRAAKALPERFELCAMLCRSQEKASRMALAYNIPVSVSPEECMDMRPDFVVVAVDKASIASVSRSWMEAGFPVLCETPPAQDLPCLKELWELSTPEGFRLQTAEQYLFYPTLAARLLLVKEGLLGDPDFVMLSLAHGYHGVSLIRHFLGVGMESVDIWGKAYRERAVETDSRWGPVLNGAVAEKERDHLLFEFEGGKTAVYDFCGIQYHSFLRSRHLLVRGARGELDDKVLRFLDEKGVPGREELQIQTDGGEDRVLSVSWNHRLVYENPFGNLGFTEDETAVAFVLDGMGRYLETGRECYPLADALQDAYLALLMTQALKTGQQAHSAPQPWSL